VALTIAAISAPSDRKRRMTAIGCHRRLMCARLPTKTDRLREVEAGGDEKLGVNRPIPFADVAPIRVFPVIYVIWVRSIK